MKLNLERLHGKNKAERIKTQSNCIKSVKKQ